MVRTFERPLVSTTAKSVRNATIITCPKRKLSFYLNSLSITHVPVNCFDSSSLENILSRLRDVSSIITVDCRRVLCTGLHATIPEKPEKNDKLADHTRNRMVRVGNHLRSEDGCGASESCAPNPLIK